MKSDMYILHFKTVPGHSSSNWHRIIFPVPNPLTLATFGSIVCLCLHLTARGGAVVNALPRIRLDSLVATFTPIGTSKRACWLAKHHFLDHPLSNFQLSASNMATPLFVVVCPLLSSSSYLFTQKRKTHPCSLLCVHLLVQPRLNENSKHIVEGLVHCPKILVVIIDVIGTDGDAPVLSSDGGSEMLWRQCFAKMDSQYFILCVSF
jgi:hypothetical protein